MFTETELQTFYQATKSRDYRFDGKFFTAVKTTGIYCRPVCPAKPHPGNIEFFRTAQDAENAGYRPCLRCRPEAAPQSPVWIGTSAIVKRAIKLIGRGDLFEDDEESFASKLGVTSRHLRRLFAGEIGVTPKQVSDTQRINFARTLIFETNLPITDIAFHAGFNSVRRFNDAFQQKFKRRPMDLRKKKNKTADQGSITLLLRYRPPYDWNSILGFFQAHTLPGIEKVHDGTYQRLFIDEHSQKPALIIVSHLPDKNALQLKVFGADTRSLFSISRKIRRMFDLDSDPLLISNTFAQSPFLKSIYEKNPGMRIPCGWDPFESAIGTILGQLVSVKHATQLLQQLIQGYGSHLKHSFDTDLVYSFPSPQILMRSSLSKLKTTNQRKETIRLISKKTNDLKIDLSEHCDFPALRTSLSEIKGIGPWSVEFICLRALGDTDAFPRKDLILARVLQRHPEIQDQKFQPWRSYLAMYLWKEFAKS